MSISASELLPHKPPMAMIDTIIENTAESKIAETVIKPDNPFLNKEGLLDPTTVPELVAQAAAASDALSNNGVIRPGFLAMARDIVIEKDIHVNDRIRILATDESPVVNWYVITFRILRQDGELCAHGEISVCLI